MGRSRDRAVIKLSIWADHEWRELSPMARYLYLALLTSSSLSHCGVADWRPNRLAAIVGLTIEQVEQAGREMVASRHLVIDAATEEALIRSFVRNDGLMKQPNMAVAMAKAYAATASAAIRGVVVHEMNRLRADFPDLAGWAKPEAVELLAGASIDPSTYPLGNGSPDPSPNPSGNPSPDPSGKGQANPSVKGCPTTTTATTTKPPVVEGGVGGDVSRPKATGRKRPARALPDDWQPNEKHADLARERGLNLERESAQFRDHAAAKDRRMVDWDAAFRQWLNSSYAKPDPAAPATGKAASRLPRADELELPPDGLSPQEYYEWSLKQVEKRGQG